MESKVWHYLSLIDSFSWSLRLHFEPNAMRPIVLCIGLYAWKNARFSIWQTHSNRYEFIVCIHFGHSQLLGTMAQWPFEKRLQNLIIRFCNSVCDPLINSTSSLAANNFSNKRKEKKNELFVQSRLHFQRRASHFASAVIDIELNASQWKYKRIIIKTTTTTKLNARNSLVQYCVRSFKYFKCIFPVKCTLRVLQWSDDGLRVCAHNALQNPQKKVHRINFTKK